MPLSRNYQVESLAQSLQINNANLGKGRRYLKPVPLLKIEKFKKMSKKREYYQYPENEIKQFILRQAQCHTTFINNQ